MPNRALPILRSKATPLSYRKLQSELVGHYFNQMRQASQCTYCWDQRSRKQIESFGDIGTHERSCLSVISFETDCMVLPGAKMRKIKKLNQ